MILQWLKEILKYQKNKSYLLQHHYYHWYYHAIKMLKLMITVNYSIPNAIDNYN